MIDPKYKRIIFLQIIVWTLFFFVSALIYKNHFELKLDSNFSIKYSLTVAIFFITNIWFIISFSRPEVEKIEEKLHHQEKAFKTEKDHLEIENRMYRIMFNSIDEPIMVITNDLNVFFYNLKLSQSFGIKEQGATFPLLELTRNFEFQNFIKNSIGLSKISELDMFSFNNDQEASRKYYNIKLIPIKFSGHFLIVFHDVTERKLADQIREDFISNFSHEIRTPLTILSGQVQNLKNSISTQLQSDNLNESFSKIDNNTRRLTSLFDDMLSLTSVEKKKELVLEEFDIEPMIDFVIQDLSLKYPSKKIKVNVSVEKNIVRGDYNLIEQVLMNLIDNSIKYSNMEPQIDIKVSQDNDQTILLIADKGIGIPESARLRIFERFFRIDISRSSEITGTGLGLAIVKHIIQKHNGKIKVQSELNVGTTFSISLPN